MNLTLYDHALSLDCYKVRLFANLNGLDVERVPVRTLPKTAQPLAASRGYGFAGDVPVLVDGKTVLRDAQAIVCYLAMAYDPVGLWLPREAIAFGHVMSWLGFASRELHAAEEARGTAVFGFPGHLEELQLRARRALRFMDDHLARRTAAGTPWFVGERPTIADIVLFPAAALSRDFDVEPDEFPVLRHWARQVRALPKFTWMEGTPYPP